MEYKSRLNYPAINGQENAFVAKSKQPTIKGIGLQTNVTKRPILGDISSNIRLQAPLVSSKSHVLANEKDSGLSTNTRPITRSYKNVPSRVDSRLISKTQGTTITLTNQENEKPLRREESTVNHATRAVAITAKLRQTKISNLATAKSLSKENLLPKESDKTKNVKADALLKNVTNVPRKIVRAEAKDVKIILPKSTIKNDSYSTELLEKVDDIDAGEESSPILMGVYIKDIYNYLKDLELQYPIRPLYLERQPHVTPKMRAMLIDWLVQVHDQFKLLLETFHLTVAIIDRYLQAPKPIKRDHIQLVGITAMFIASKYEEMFAPDIQDFVYISDHAYTKSEILQCEKSILVTLDFSLGRPLPLHFLRRFIKAASVRSTRTHILAKFLVDLCLVDYQMVHYRPSELSAAAVCFSIAILSPNKSLQECWTPTLSFYAGYSFDSIHPIIRKMADILTVIDSCKYKAVAKKYNSTKFGKISSIPELKKVKVIPESAL